MSVMTHQPAAGRRPTMQLPRQFITSTPLVVTEKTHIVAAASPGEEDGDPCEDGWFLSDFYAMNYLYKGQGANQVWLTAADPGALLENFGNFLHGNPRQECKVVLSQDLLDAGELTHPVVVRTAEIIERCKDEVRKAAAAAARDGGDVLVLLFCHGLERRFCLDTSDDENRLTVQALREAAGPDVRLALVASACYAGGWLVYPDVNAAGRRRAASPPADGGSGAPPWLASDSLRRECGFLFIPPITHPVTSRTSNPLLAEKPRDAPADAAKAQREAPPDATDTKKQCYRALRSAARNVLAHRLYRAVAYQQFTFRVQDDDWAGAWAEGADAALARYARRWDRLAAHAAPSPWTATPPAAIHDGRGQKPRGGEAARNRKHRPVLSWAMRKRVRLLAKLYLELCPGDGSGSWNLPLNGTLRHFEATGYPQSRRHIYGRQWNLFAVVQYRMGRAHLADNLVDFFQLPRPGRGADCLQWRSFWYDEGDGEGILVNSSTIFRWLKFSEHSVTVQGPTCSRAKRYLSIALAMANRGVETTRQMVDQINALLADVVAHGQARVLADPEVRRRCRDWAQASGRRVREDLLP